MADKETGWIKLFRSTMYNKIWLNNEPFTRGQAWIDLLMMAAHDDMEILFNGHHVKVKRGSLITSISYLTKRWHRSEHWVRNTLKILAHEHMLYTEGGPKGTTITIEKYASFQDSGRTKGGANGGANGGQYKNVYTRGDGADGTGLAASVVPSGEDRYMKVTNYETGQTFIYDTVEERYLNDGEERDS